MATIPKILADGQVAAAKAMVYTVPNGMQSIIRTVSFANVTAVVQTVLLYVKRSGSVSRLFSRASLNTDEFAHEEEIGTLAAGDQIEMATTTATSVDFTIMGVEVPVG